MSIEQSPPRASILATGFALFSMFFGAGNLVFPLIIGQSSGTETNAAIAGLALSAVAFPFLGLIAMMLYRGDLKAFLARLGKWPAFALMFVLYMSQGPASSLPRLVTLMHASVQPYLPSFSLTFFSIFICAVVFFLTVKKSRIIDLLGVILTPLLLATLGLLVGVGIYHAPDALPSAEGTGYHFVQGLKGGYLTLDLTAALLFATMIMPHLARGLDPAKAKKELGKRMACASLIAAGLLMVTYIGLCWLSAHHSHALGKTVEPVDLLHAIAVRILGPTGGIVAAVAVFLACLTTAISLAAVFTDYLKVEIFKNKLPTVPLLVFTLATTAAMANLGFTGLAKILGPALEILYPGLIVLCLVNIGYHLYQLKPIKAPVFLALAAAAIGAMVQ